MFEMLFVFSFYAIYIYKRETIADLIANRAVIKPISLKVREPMVYSVHNALLTELRRLVSNGDMNRPARIFLPLPTI